MKKSLYSLIFLILLTGCLWHKHPTANEFQLYNPDFHLLNSKLKLDGVYAYWACDHKSIAYWKFFNDGRVYHSQTKSKQEWDSIDVNTYPIDNFKNMVLWGYYSVDSNRIEIEIGLAGVAINSPFLYRSGIVTDSGITLSKEIFTRQYYLKKRHRDRSEMRVHCSTERNLKFMRCCPGNLQRQ